MKPLKWIVYAGCILSLCWAVSCKSSKKAVRESTEVSGSREDFFEKFEREAFRFETLSAKLKVNWQTPKNSMGSRVDLKIVKDEVILLSVQPFLGIEVARIRISPDSIWVLDRMNKRYVAEDLSAMKGKLPVDFNFYNLQALFSDRIFVPGNRSVMPADYRKFALHRDNGQAELKITDAMELVYRFSVDRENKLTDTYVSDKSGRYALQWRYADFRVTGQQLFPMRMDVQVTDNGAEKGKIEFYFNKIDVDKPVNPDFSIPAKYNRVTFEEVVKLLTRAVK
ncbi:MAG: DUF4292 domain-containing protein [Parabacteroides sp.]|nr:DUF4292 domain-containing protein [Parabacteroides sp.]